MSADARMLQLIDDAVRRATEPLERAVDELSARLAALEGSDGQSAAGAPKKPARGRTPRAKTQPAEVTAVTGDGVATEPADDGPQELADPFTEASGSTSEKVPEQRKGAGK